MTAISLTGAFFNESLARPVTDAVGFGRVVLVGGASKGPVNKPVRCPNVAALIAAFGGPLNTDDGLHGALSALNLTQQVYYMRVAGSTAEAASVFVPGLTGGTPAVNATGTLTVSNSALPADGDTVTIDDGVNPPVVFEFDDDNSVGGSNVAVAIDGNTGLTTADRVANTVLNLLAAINNRRDINTPDPFTISGTLASTYVINLINLVPGVAGNETITVSMGATVTPAGMTGGAAAVPGVSSATVLEFVSKDPGTYANYLRVQTQATTVPGAPAGRFDVIVSGPDPANITGPVQALEFFRNVSMDPNSPRFVKTVLESQVSIQNPPSALLTVNVLVPGSTVTVAPGVYTLGTNGGAVGDNGLPLTAPDIIGTVSGNVATGLKALRNPEAFHFDYVCVPGVSHKDVISELLALATYRGTCNAIIDPPFGLSRNEAMAWHNGLDNTTPNAPDAPLDSSYGVLVWPWVKEYDQYSRTFRWYPPSAKVAGAASQVDANYGQNYSPAGHVRGKIPGREVEYSASPEDRLVLNGPNGNINPIVAFENEGLLLYGNLTLARDEADPCRYWSIRKAIIEAQLACTLAVRVLVFDPNDETMWRSFEDLANERLTPIIQKRGLADARVICNADTNPLSQRRTGRAFGRINLVPIYPGNLVVIGFAIADGIAQFETAQFVNPQVV